MRDRFIERLSQLAERDPRIMLITGDLGFGVLDKFRRRFPRQFINCGVAEQSMAGLATGLALEGHIVYTYSIANFVFMRCLEQIRNDAAFHDCNVKVVCVGGGFSYGPLGISHHATEDLAIMRALSNVTVIAPCDRWEASEATEAIARHQGVCYLRLDKSAADDFGSSSDTFSLGRMRTLREGTDITLVATGGIMGDVLQAANELAEQGIDCRVLSAHTIKPLDVESVCRAAQETDGLITVEEHTVDGGLGGAVAEALLEFGRHPIAFYRIGLRAGFSSIVGSQRYLRQQYGMDVLSIIEAVHRLRARSSQQLKWAG
jgi:transketolase